MSANNHITFNNALRNFLETDFKTRFAEIGLKINEIVSDISMLPLGIQAEDEPLIVLVDGNATRVKNETFSYLTNSVSLWCNIPLNLKNDFMAKLEEFAEEMSSPNKYFKLENSYYATFNFNTPTTDGIIHNHTYVLVNLFGMVNYSNQFATGVNEIPVIKIDETILRNVTNYNVQTAAITENITNIGLRFQEKFKQFEQATYQITVLYDNRDDLHKKLKQMGERAIDQQSGEFISLKQKIKILNSNNEPTVNFEEYIAINFGVALGGVPTIQITIVR